MLSAGSLSSGSRPTIAIASPHKAPAIQALDDKGPRGHQKGGRQQDAESASNAFSGLAMFSTGKRSSQNRDHQPTVPINVCR